MLTIKFTIYWLVFTVYCLLFTVYWLLFYHWWMIKWGIALIPYCFLVLGCWSLFTASWFLVAVYWSLFTASWFLVAVYWSLITASWFLVAVYWSLITACHRLYPWTCSQCQLHLLSTMSIHVYRLWIYLLYDSVSLWNSIWCNTAEIVFESTVPVRVGPWETIKISSIES